MVKLRLYIFGKNIRNDIVPFSVQRVHDVNVLLRLINWSLLKLVSVRFLHHEAIIFPFVINEDLMGKSTETKQILHFSSHFLLTLASTDSFCL